MNYVRTTVSIPKQIHDLMRRYETTHPEVNWSKIAAEAYAKVIGMQLPLSIEERLQRIENHRHAVAVVHRRKVTEDRK